MPIALSKDELLAITEGVSRDSAERISFRGVEFDSREIKGGELFVALPGLQAHGHEYLEQAYQRGAALVLVEDERMFEQFPDSGRVVYVKNSLAAFWALAKYWRDTLEVPVLAITGSVGKTTVKEMAASILLQTGVGLYSIKSYNNHVGVPYTLCRLNREHKWAVIEIGMNHPGEIGPLAKLVTPDVALITLIAPAHIENFADINQILAEKLEITTGLKPNGTLVINADDQLLTEATSGRANTVTAGYALGAAFRVFDVKELGIEGLSFKATLQNEPVDLKLGVIGRHNVTNAALAALGAATLSKQVGIAQIKTGLKNFSSPLNRLALVELSEGRHIVDDSYNANPASMNAMFETARGFITAGKSVGLVLGEMRELGKDSDRFHHECAQNLARINPKFVVGVGEKGRIFTEVCQAAGIEVFNAAELEPVVTYLEAKPVDIVFIKASRAVGLDRIVALLLR